MGLLPILPKLESDGVPLLTLSRALLVPVPVPDGSGSDRFRAPAGIEVGIDCGAVFQPAGGSCRFGGNLAGPDRGR
jgi:hypothetical protein